jgi:hypothetical protein
MVIGSAWQWDFVADGEVIVPLPCFANELGPVGQRHEHVTEVTLGEYGDVSFAITIEVAHGRDFITQREPLVPLRCVLAEPAPSDSDTNTSPNSPRVKVTMSSLPSPLKSPTAETSLPNAKWLCQVVAGSKPDPLDSDTIAKPESPRVKVTTSVLPSPLKSPASGIS